MWSAFFVEARQGDLQSCQVFKIVKDKGGIDALEPAGQLIDRLLSGCLGDPNCRRISSAGEALGRLRQNRISQISWLADATVSTILDGQPRFAYSACAYNSHQRVGLIKVGKPFQFRFPAHKKVGNAGKLSTALTLDSGVMDFGFSAF